MCKIGIILSLGDLIGTNGIQFPFILPNELIVKMTHEVFGIM